MNTERLSGTLTRWVPFFLLLSRLLAPSLAASTETDTVGANCPRVSVQAESGLALGTVRTLPGRRGFLELHPHHGISVSNDGVVHQGPWGTAVLRLAGPPGKRIMLELTFQQTSTHHTANLRLSELIVLLDGKTRRLEAEGDTLSLRLPKQERADGRARLTVEIGAVLAFRHRSDPQEARYRLTATCLSVQS